MKKLPYRTDLEEAVIQLITEDSPEPGRNWTSESKSEYEDTLRTYMRSKKPTLEMFQRALNWIGENDKVVDPATKIKEWSDEYSKYKALCMPNGNWQGILRDIRESSIGLAQYRGYQ